MSFQILFAAEPDEEMPWFAWTQFWNFVGNTTDQVIEEENWQPMIDAIWENRTVEDYENKNSVVRNDFMRHWNHDRSGKSISLDELVEEGGDIMNVATRAQSSSAKYSRRGRLTPLQNVYLSKTARFSCCAWNITLSSR